MHHYRIITVLIVLFIPYFFKLFFRTDHLAPVLTEQPQNIKFNRCQCQRYLIVNTLVRGTVQGQTTHIEHIPGILTHFIVLRIPAELGIDARHQF